MPIEVTTNRRKQPLHIGVFSPPGVTKTWSTISASAHCPEGYSHLASAPPLALTEDVVLKDMLWVTQEPGATVGLEQSRIIVPEIDMSDIDPKAWEQTVKQVHAVIGDRIAKGETTNVVIDTVTALSATIEKVVEVRYPDADGQKYWGKVAELHRDWFLPLTRMNATFFHLSHAKDQAKIAGNSDTAQTQRAALELKQKAWGFKDIGMSIPGKSKGMYYGALALVLWAYKGSEKLDGETRPQSGYFFKSEDATLDVKRRLRVPPVMPADWRWVKRHLVSQGG